jgi:hypothetical protein
MLWPDLPVYIRSSALSSTLVPAVSSLLCGLWIVCILHCLSLGVLGLLLRRGWAAVVVVVRRMLLSRALLCTPNFALHFSWILWHLAILEMFDSLALDGSTLFSRRRKHNECDTASLGYPRVTNCSLSTFLV